MPRFAIALPLVAVAGCVFDADYSHAHLRCSDGKCPSGMTCYASTGLCGVPDAALGGDGARDGSSGGDAHVPALTCADPGIIATTSGTTTLPGNTAGHTNLLSTMCGGAVYNAPDTEYRIEGPGAVTIGIDSMAGLNAYVIGACTAFPTCETNVAATPSAPLSITLTSGTHLVVVDGITANITGSYTLTITR